MSRKQPDAPRVGIVMGSDSDWPVMKAAGEALEEFDVAYEADVVSAHRMPDEMLAYGRDAASRGALRDHRRGGRGRPPAGDARLGHPAAGDRGAGGAQVPRRHGLAAVHRPDAGRRTGGDRRRGQRPQRRPARGAHPRRDRRRPAAADARLPGRAPRHRPGQGQGRARRVRAQARLLQSRTRPRSALVRPRRVFASSRRRCEPREGFVGTRGSGGGARPSRTGRRGVRARRPGCGAANGAPRRRR